MASSRSGHSGWPGRWMWAGGAGGASGGGGASATPVTSKWSAMASSRSGHSGWPGPISCLLQSRWVKSPVLLPVGFRGPVFFRIWSRLMNAQHKITSLLDQLNTVIVGKRAQVQDCVACLLAGGHLLIEDMPGVGKTTLAHALSHTFGLQFSRVQFTADLMPSDLTGVSVDERGKQAFVFHPGPVFAQVLLADEINRASPRTQSALLEAMEEKQVSVEGETRALPQPFFVI